MHRNYLFLVNYNPDLSPEERADEAQTDFENYSKEHCDENNWHTELAIVFQDGEYYLYEGCEERLGEDRKFFDDIPKEKRFRTFADMAVRSVAKDLELNGSTSFYFGSNTDENKAIEAMSAKAILAEIDRQIPKKIQELYQRFLDKSTDKEDQGGLGSYKRRKKVRIFEKLQFSKEFGFPPFTEACSPYDYAMFDLTAGSDFDKGDVAILIVDIHT